MKNVVTLMFKPDIRICEGAIDYKVPAPGRTIYCIGENNLPSDRFNRAREILRRLAYGFHNYAAREVVARFHRDLKRSEGKKTIDPSAEQRKADVMIALRVKRAIREAHDGIELKDLISVLSLPPQLIERAVNRLVQNGSIEVCESGGSRYLRSIPIRLNRP